MLAQQYIWFVNRIWPCNSVKLAYFCAPWHRAAELKPSSVSGWLGLVKWWACLGLIWILFSPLPQESASFPPFKKVSFPSTRARNLILFSVLPLCHRLPCMCSVYFLVIREEHDLLCDFTSLDMPNRLCSVLCEIGHLDSPLVRDVASGEKSSVVASLKRSSSFQLLVATLAFVCVGTEMTFNASHVLLLLITKKGSFVICFLT